MLVKTETVSKKLNDICQNAIFNRESVVGIINKLRDKYDIPTDYSNDLLTLRKKFDNEPLEILYCFVSVLIPESVDKYFTDVEKKKLATYKFKKKR